MDPAAAHPGRAAALGCLAEDLNSLDSEANLARLQIQEQLVIVLVGLANRVLPISTVASPVVVGGVGGVRPQGLVGL